MNPTFSKNALALLLLSSLHLIGSDFVSGGEPSCSDMVFMMVDGARVERGRDWKWGDEDGTPPTQGTVTGPSRREGWFLVHWDSNDTYSYRMGADDKCDLKIVHQNTSPEFVSGGELSCSEMISMMEVGARVERGRDWEWGNQDGTPPTQGTVLRTSDPGWFNVKWDVSNDNTHAYRMGYKDKCDLKIVQRSTDPTLSSSPSTTQSTGRSSILTTPLPESSTSSAPPSPTCHQCTCCNETSDSQSKAEAETAELAREAARLAVEAGQLSVMTARVALEAAKAEAWAEEALRLLEVEAKQEELATAQAIARAEEAKAKEAEILVEALEVALETAKSTAKAEQSWATNAAEELEFERSRRNQTL